MGFTDVNELDITIDSSTISDFCKRGLLNRKPLESDIGKIVCVDNYNYSENMFIVQICNHKCCKNTLGVIHKIDDNDKLIFGGSLIQLIEIKEEINMIGKYICSSGINGNAMIQEEQSIQPFTIGKIVTEVSFESNILLMSKFCCYCSKTNKLVLEPDVNDSGDVKTYNVPIKFIRSDGSETHYGEYLIDKGKLRVDISKTNTKSTTSRSSRNTLTPKPIQTPVRRLTRSDSNSSVSSVLTRRNSGIFSSTLKKEEPSVKNVFRVVLTPAIIF